MACPETLPILSCNASLSDAAPAKIMAPLPRAALERLPQLYAEGRLALRRSRLLARAVPAAGPAAGNGRAGGAPLVPSFA
jgi:hypothetical protein